jgi:hypothetical protein
VWGVGCGVRGMGCGVWGVGCGVWREDGRGAVGGGEGQFKDETKETSTKAQKQARKGHKGLGFRFWV